jgi:hypothetical protein
MAVFDQFKSDTPVNNGPLTFTTTGVISASDQFKADKPIQFGPITPVPFQGTTPNLPPASLTSYQLALADQLVKGTTPPFGVNPNFIAAMNTFASSKLLTPATIDPKTGQRIQPPFAPGLAGTSYIVIGEMIHIVRRAQDCGPNEVDRYEKVAIENLANVAIRTWQYYGEAQPNGSAASGTGETGFY